MTLKQVKYNYNRRVLHSDPMRHLRDVPCILRRVAQGLDERSGEYFYEALIQDVDAPHSVSWVPLESLEEMPL